MEALIFIVRTLLQVLLVTVFLLRVLLPLARADSRNQLSQAVIRLTNPLVLPLRRIVPPIGKVDTASIVALILVQMAATATLWLLGAYPRLFSVSLFLLLDAWQRDQQSQKPQPVQQTTKQPPAVSPANSRNNFRSCKAK